MGMYQYFKQIYLKRDLVRELVLKDLRVRYARPLFGVLWIFFSPLLTVAVFYIIFNLFLKVNTSEAPFILYLMTAVFTWRFLQDSLMCSVTSLVDNKNLIRESNFPHYLIPLSIVISNAIILVPSYCILLICAFLLGALSFWVVFLPLILAVHFIITLGLSIMCSVFYVRFRDLRYFMEALLLLLFYLTPAFYSISLVKAALPEFLFKIYMCNPLTILLNLYRMVTLRGFFGAVQGQIEIINAISLLVIFAFVVLLLGFHSYRLSRKSINDYISY